MPYTVLKQEIMLNLQFRRELLRRLALCSIRKKSYQNRIFSYHIVSK